MSFEDADYMRLRTLTFEVSEEALKRANIQQDTPITENFTEQRWHISYSYSEDQNVILTIQINYSVGNAIIHTPLGQVIFSILVELKRLFASPKALKLLAVEESDIESTMIEECTTLIVNYINYLPLVMFHSFNQALNETMISHVKKFVDYDLRKHYEDTGKPQKKFTLLPNNKLYDLVKMFPDTEFVLLRILDQADEEFSAYRAGTFSNRKVWLNNQTTFLQLPSEYEGLREQYNKLKKDYVKMRAAFFLTNRRATIAEWEKYWEEFCSEDYPNLIETDEVIGYTASKLAFKHLAGIYGFNTDYMEKLIRNAKAQIKSKTSKEKSG